MAIGGFNGTDPAPTLAQFEAYVPARARSTTSSPAAASAAPAAAVAGGGGTTAASQITTWVESHFTATTVGGVTALRPDRAGVAGGDDHRGDDHCGYEHGGGRRGGELRWAARTTSPAGAGPRRRPAAGGPSQGLPAAHCSGGSRRL